MKVIENDYFGYKIVSYSNLEYTVEQMNGVRVSTVNDIGKAKDIICNLKGFQYPMKLKAIGDEYTVEFTSRTVGVVLNKGSSDIRNVGDRIGGLDWTRKDLWEPVDCKKNKTGVANITESQKNHIGNALLCMCRYAYTRNTSADMACNSALKSLWEFVPDNQKQLILEEIQSELDLGIFVNDPMLWEDFLKWEREQNDRG